MLKLLKSGFFTTVQDTGRFHYRNNGVPISGAMDEISAKAINAILGNTMDAAVLEITMTGPILEFKEDTYICLGGAELSATLNNRPIRNYECYKIEKGDILSYGKLLKGFRGYLAVKGGFQTTVILGSRSFYNPITPNRCLKGQESLRYDRCIFHKPKLQLPEDLNFLEEQVLEVSKGPEYGLLSEQQLEELFSRDFSVAKENNRMAYQIEETITPHKHAILTSATLPGTIQLTPKGKLIALMKDGQTTGGYPRILQLSARAIAILAQKRAGDSIKFSDVNGEIT
ncbi:5-oxoprolinase subunit C family protein [Spongiimicrobium salis]|uniref:5-oxoprolinase subunit C family protein n=1 Tax=Spongiimicrobium salis TaxID=1667022 RepID=UPI00374CEBA5